MAEELIEPHDTPKRSSAALDLPRAGARCLGRAARAISHPSGRSARAQHVSVPLGGGERARQTLHEASSSRFGHLSASLEEGHAKFAAGQALQSEGALEQAAAEYAAARRAVPSSPAIALAIEACAKAMDEQLERAAHLAARLTVADEAAARSDWTALLAIVQ